MPNADQHDRLSLLVLPPLAALSWRLCDSLAFTTQDHLGCTIALLLGHTIGSFLLNPDLDCHSRPYTRWLWLRAIWLPYRWLMRHRSPLSHGFAIGTTFRLLYLGAWIAWALLWYWCGARWWYGQHRPELWVDWNLEFGFRLTLLWSWLTVRHPEWTIACLIGLECGAMLHVLADTVVSAWRRFWRGLRVGRDGS